MTSRVHQGLGLKAWGWVWFGLFFTIVGSAPIVIYLLAAERGDALSVLLLLIPGALLWMAGGLCMIVGVIGLGVRAGRSETQ